MIVAIDIPKAESQRLNYRLLNESDRELFCSLFMDASTMRYIGSPLSRERAERRFNTALQAKRHEHLREMTAIVERTSGLFLGIANLHMIDAHKRHAERGLMLLPNACGQGFGLECSTALRDYSFERFGLNAVYMRIAAGNTRMERVAIRSGYTPLAELADTAAWRDWCLTRDSWTNRILSVARPGFEKLRALPVRIDRRILG
jgi:RimJ/RimL family protein N-acetyltransferase